MAKRKRPSQASGLAPGPSKLQRRKPRKSPAQRAAEAAAREGKHLIDKVTFWD